jgi:hypothetical protein
LASAMTAPAMTSATIRICIHSQNGDTAAQRI